MKKITMGLVALLLAALCFAEEYPMRTWTWKNGKQTEEGSFAGTFTNKNGKASVRIRKSSGREATPVIKWLSNEDQAYIESVSK